MKKTVCIYPEDQTTAFLQPVYQHICTNLNAVGFNSDTTDEDDSLEKIYDEIKDAGFVIFLGHGTSKELYGSRFDNIVFNATNINILHNKKVLLVACKSEQFIQKFKLKNAIGFGNMPTSLDDARTFEFIHEISIRNFTSKEINIYKEALIRILIYAISDEAINDFHLFKERLKFLTHKEIVECLLHKESNYYRELTDIIYYIYKDMIIT
ncbi:MAG: hypothetical protein II852_11275 [Bacteroidales bacterium]|nr:hypothetical protein [Bacteroidales bacterium]